jgi:hypothetical protein
MLLDILYCAIVNYICRQLIRYARRHMKNISINVAIGFICFAASSSQAAETAISESRDASTAYLGTANFVVGQVGRDCLSLIGRSETPQAFVATWQQRNTKYLIASQKYIEARIGEAQAAGGLERRNAVMGALLSAVRDGAEATVKSWLDRPEKGDACTRAVALIDSGKYDISATTPMYAELESLVSWAQN